MKRYLLILLLLFSVTGCALIWGPTATVKKFMSAVQKGDAETMTQLFSSKAIQSMGLDKIKSNNQRFAELCQKSAATSPYRMDDIQETKNGETARVSFLYRNKAQTDSIKLVFDLSKEGSTWKIDDIGGAEKEMNTNLETPSPAAPVETIPPPPPLPGNTGVKNENAASATKHAPISGGVLNGKAISLPQPPYPPVAKAAHASGTVTVQVTIDEKGNVISATAVSGHPLLRAAATAAARQARFAPTKLSGEPVKVNGVITYNFVAQQSSARTQR